MSIQIVLPSALYALYVLSHLSKSSVGFRENLIATGSSTRSVVKTRMFASYTSSGMNWVAKRRARGGSESLYGKAMTALFVGRKFRGAVRGTEIWPSDGTSPRTSSKTVHPPGEPPP